MQATNGSTAYNASPAINPTPTYVTVIRERRPSGMLARILHNVEEYPPVLKIGAIAIPIILTIATYLLLLAKFPADHSFSVIKKILALTCPIVVMNELTSFVKEYIYQENITIKRG